MTVRVVRDTKVEYRGTATGVKVRVVGGSPGGGHRLPDEGLSIPSGSPIRCLLSVTGVSGSGDS